jgi:phosphoribosylanthranilate isomerase
VILSGGLTPQNVAEAIAAVRPFAVDVASGVEASPGRKDLRKLEAFAAAVASAATPIEATAARR